MKIIDNFFQSLNKEIRQKSGKIAGHLKKRPQPTKRATLGLEVELFILDHEGNAVSEADKLLEKIAEKKQDEGQHIVKEAVKNIIEVGSYPEKDGTNTMLALLENLKLLVYTAEELNLLVLPLATYPGKASPKVREDARYKAQQQLFGKERFDQAGLCTGYHCHYALPWGVFDAKNLTLKPLLDSKNQESLLSMYNLLIAMDPALTTFMQSSPFLQGQHLAKDSRMLAYRGGEDLNYMEGLYANYDFFGGLPPYEYTGTDLMSSIEKRHQEWQQALVNAGVAPENLPKYNSILQTNWSPVKINSHGTIEQRGMDMNHLPILLSVSILMRALLRYVQEDYFQVRPHDSAKVEPFKLEGKTIFIPPHTYVKKELQKLSAYEGLNNEKIYNYCRRLVNLVKTLEGQKIEWLIEPLETMLAEKATVADKIISLAEKLGHTNLSKPLPDEIAREIALQHARQMFKDMVIVQKMIEINQ